MTTLAPGQTLSFYEILGHLGSGAMGEVYRARDTRLGRDVALKVLPEELAGDEERLRRFEQEARTLASLNHPNVAGIHGVDSEDGLFFLSLELVEGEDLAQRIARGPLTLEETVALGREIAEGLEAAHAAGVIHRDLKPANVRVTPDGRAKLLDFGLARSLLGAGEGDARVTTEAGRLLGTPAYMAPEQARGQPVDRRVDLWALGCVLFECLAGRSAFGGDTASDVLAAVLEREPDWSRLPRALPTELRDLLERCLRKDPRRRLQDAGDARIRLEELGEGVGVEAPREARLAWPLVGLAATTVLALGLAAWSFGRGDARVRRRIEVVNPLTNSPVWTASVNWSPGADFIVYSEAGVQSLDLYRKPARGGIPEVLVSLPGDEVSPRVSPDGSRVAFVTSAEEGCPVRLLSLQGDGRTTRVVSTGIAILDLNSQLDCLGDRPWTEDSAAILVSIVDGNGRMAVHHVEVETGAATPLTHPGPGEGDFAASFSFQYDRIVFHRAARGGATLWMLPASGGEPVALTDATSASFNPAWRIDGERVAFRRSTHAGSYDLWELDVASGDELKLTFETRRVWTLSVAKDDRIAYTSSDHDTFLHRVSRRGDPTLERLNAHTGDNFGARPSPLGNKIAYHSTQTGGVELWLYDTGGGPESRLTRNSSADMYADWSPDGRQLVFVSDQDGPFRMYVLDLESGTRRPLGDEPLSTHWSNIVNASILARWSQDEDDPRVAFIVSGDAPALWTIRPDGTDAREVLPDVYGFDWYLDSRRGIATRLDEEGRSELVAVDLDSGETRVLLRRPHTEIEAAPDGTAVSFTSGHGHFSMELFVLELEPAAEPGGLPRALGEPVRRTFGEGRWHVHNGGWMPDSQSLVFTRDEDFGDAFELIEKAP